MRKDNQYDAFQFLKCKDCTHCNAKANLEGETASSLCPINHKEIKVGKPWFASYHVGNAPICKNFAPSKTLKWLYDRWEGLDRYLADKREVFEEENIPMSHFEPKEISLILDDNFSIRYMIPYSDWFNCRVNINNYTEKMYYKRSKESPFGYKLVREKNNKSC